MSLCAIISIYFFLIIFQNKIKYISFVKKFQISDMIWGSTWLRLIVSDW